MKNHKTNGQTHRNAFATMASFRSAQKFRHKCAGRGGARNDHRDYLDEYEEE